MVNIALFGTSADPPTAAHQTILKWLSDRYDLVAVWTSDNPFKSHQTPLEHRCQMLRIMIRGIEPPRENIQLQQNLSSPRTLETVNKARQYWGEQVELSLVVGSDLIEQLPRWHKIEELLQQVRLLIIPRPGYDIDEGGLEELKTLGATLEVADLDAPAVSSTAYREQKDKDALTPPVEDYIHQEQLYECQNAATNR